MFIVYSALNYPLVGHGAGSLPDLKRLRVLKHKIEEIFHKFLLGEGFESVMLTKRFGHNVEE